MWSVVSSNVLFEEEKIMKRCSLLLIITVVLAACAGTTTPAASPLASPVVTPAAPPEQSGATATPTSGRVAVFPETIIVYQRTGGFVGTSDQWTIYPTGRIVAGDGAEWQVSPEQVAPLFKLVESAEFDALNENYAPAGACDDCYTYTVTVYGQGEPQTVTFLDGGDWPAALQQLLPLLNTAVAPRTQ